MLFFFLNMGISLIISLLLLLLLFRSLHVNWRRQNRWPAGYLTPIVLTMVFAWLAVTQTVPRLLDLPLVLGNRMITEEIVFTAEKTGWISIEGNDQKFIYNRWRHNPVPGVLYKVSYTPYSRQIFSLQEADDSISRSPRE